MHHMCICSIYCKESEDIDHGNSIKTVSEKYLHTILDGELAARLLLGRAGRGRGQRVGAVNVLAANPAIVRQAVSSLHTDVCVPISAAVRRRIARVLRVAFLKFSILM